ncbi:hypothetical protein AK88_00323 [Plasmodium fragile]|uniref:RAP domain-containing protein n=1 Tax=Plasmodium fragile TaxID=5857 RepID=A0A0D9QSP2_PLAFR|nr:uncharacterized protein AK88_00323 [Plasmodium fragile]KJP89867.1 hypothetical protein AK88_00323 [Plasmodium fragile]
MNKSIGAQIPLTWNKKAWGKVCHSRYVSTNFEYSPSSTISRFKAIPIVERDSTKWQKKSSLPVQAHQTLFPDNNDAFLELIKKSSKDKKEKNDLSLWHKYCREVKIRINEKNIISPRMITTFFTFLSQMDYKNDRLISEVLNRCILRLHEFDLVHMCALLNALARMNFRSAYFLDEARKKLMREGDSYFERHSPHYVCLLVNSLAKLGCAPEGSNSEGSLERSGVELSNEEGTSHITIAGEEHSGDDGTPDGQLLSRLVQRIQHRNAVEYSLLGLSLLLYNVSKFGLHKYYHLFGQFEKHIVKVKNDLNMIQLVNILTAYEKTSLLNLSLLDELLQIPILHGVEKDRKFSVHHMARLLNISLSFVLYTKERNVLPPGGSDALGRIGQQVVHMFNQMCRQVDKCRGKDLPLVCLTLSRNKKLIIRKDGQQRVNGNSPYLIFSFPKHILNTLFEQITRGVKKYINTYNHVQLSTILYCYASYDIRDRKTLFHLIKLRSLKIFSSFGQKSFSFLFHAFKRMNIEDVIFEKSCLNRMAQLGHFSCVQSFCLTLSAYASVRKDRQREDLSRLMFSNFRRVLFNVASGQHISRLASLLTKVHKIPHAQVLNLLASRYQNYEHTLSTASCTTLLTSLSNLCAHLTENEAKPSWRNYYHFVNSLTTRILADSHLYRSKDLLINFLHGSGKTFPAFAKCTKVDENKMFYFEKILKIVLPHVYPFVDQMSVGEIAVLVECLRKENYSREAIAAVVDSASGMQVDELGGALLGKVKRLLRGGHAANEEAANGEAANEEDNIRIANAITVWRGLLMLGLHDQELFQLMVQRCILSSQCLSSVTCVSQAIHYVCVYMYMHSATSEPIPKKRHVDLLQFLLNIVQRLMVNEGLLHFNCRDEDDQLLPSEENLSRFTNEPLLEKALTGLCEAVVIILPHVFNIEMDLPAQLSYPSDKYLYSIAFRPLMIILIAKNRAKTSGTMKRMSRYGRVRKRKKGLLVGYDRMTTSKYHIRNEQLLTSVDRCHSWVQGARSRYAKSIILQKESSLLLKDVIHWGHKNEQVNKIFLRLVKDSLHWNPLNVGSLFNLVYFYFMKIENGGSTCEQKPTRKTTTTQNATRAERSCLLYCHLLHSMLMHICRGQFRREKAAVLKGKPRGRNIRAVFFSLFKEDVKRENFQIRLVRRIGDKWNTIPCMSDQTLLIILVENMHLLCLINYRMGLWRDVFYYANFLLHLLQIRRLSGLLKANHFSLSATLCMAKAACSVLACSGDERIHHSTHLRAVSALQGLQSGDVRLEKGQNGMDTRDVEQTDDSPTTRCSTNASYKEALTLLKCEERFLSFLLSEEDTTMRAKHVVEQDYMLEQHVHHPLSSLITKINLCIHHCLNYRQYHTLAQFLMWRARLYYHVGLFRKCLSDTSKVALMNLHASASLRMDVDEGGGGGGEEEEGGRRTANYSCVGLILSCMHRLNLLRASDSYLLIPLMRGGTTGSYTWKGKATCTPTDHTKKNHIVNKREHPYSWCRSAEDKTLLRVLHGNRKKIPFTL